MAGLDDILKKGKAAGAPKAEPVDLASVPVQDAPKKNTPPAAPARHDAERNRGSRQFGEVHDTAKASGERLNQSALAMAQTAITLAKLGRQGNIALTKLLDIGELVKFDPSSGSDGEFTVVARAWVAKVVNPDVSKLEGEDKKKFEAAKTDDERERVLHEIGKRMIAAVAVKIQDYITAEDDRVAGWINTSRQAMVDALGLVTGPLLKK